MPLLQSSETYLLPLRSNRRPRAAPFFLAGFVLAALLLTFLLASPGGPSSAFLWNGYLTRTHAAIHHVPTTIGPTPRLAIHPPPLVPLEIAGKSPYEIEFDGEWDRAYIATQERPLRPQKQAAAFLWLSGMGAVISAGLSSHASQVQAVIGSFQAVFWGGSESLLHHGAIGHLLTEQQELTVNFMAAFLACSVSVSLTYPVDTLKTRMQAKDFNHAGTTFKDLYKGLGPALLASCPSASFFLAVSYFVKRMLMAFPAITSSGPLVASLMSGAICNMFLSLYKVPSDMVVKMIQTDVCKTLPQAMHRTFCSPGALRILFAVWTIILLKAIPTGALKIAVYEAYDLLFTARFAALGLSKFTKSMICGACSGVTTGLLTTPFDVVMTRIMTQVHDMVGYNDPNKLGKSESVKIDGLSLVRQICREIYSERGIAGFFVGAFLRASYYAPSSCSFFAVFETLKVVFSRAMLGR